MAREKAGPAGRQPGEVPEGDDLAELARIWRRPVDRVAQDGILLFFRLLLDWSARINLTAAESLAALVRRHLPDSFALAARVAEGERVADVGSGGGLPALPFAILRPDCPILLAEPTAKKVAFLRTAVRELGLRGVSILPGRITGGVEAGRADWSDIGSPPADTALTQPPPTTFDVVSSRATFPIGDWLPLGATLARPGGRVLAFATSRWPKGDRPPPTLTLAGELPYATLDSGRRWLLEFRRG